jgi:hypothetical protein
MQSSDVIMEMEMYVLMMYLMNIFHQQNVQTLQLNFQLIAIMIFAGIIRCIQVQK